MTTIRILIADDHEIVRRGLKALLETQPGWEVVDEASNGMEAIDKAAESQPDLIILDVSLPKLDGIKVAQQVSQIRDSKVIMFSHYDSPDLVREALANGAHGYVLKSDAGRELFAAIETVRQHKTFLSSSLRKSLPEIQ